ncbi:hypothetical protein ACWGE1_17955 [Streptomyces sp. NPDC054932]
MTLLRLTCLYGGVFMVAGAVLLAVLSLLAMQAVSRGSAPVLELGSETSVVLMTGDCAAPTPAVGSGPTDSGPHPCAAGQGQQAWESPLLFTLLALVALAALSIAAGYVMARYALSPLRSITDNARSACRQDARFVPRT